jgi:hypothetical protein
MIEQLAESLLLVLQDLIYEESLDDGQHLLNWSWIIYHDSLRFALARRFLYIAPQWGLSRALFSWGCLLLWLRSDISSIFH